MLECEADCGPVRLEAAVARARLADGTGDFVAILIEHDNVRCERVGRRGLAAPNRMLVVVAGARQSGAGLEHHNIEPVLVANESDPGREIQIDLAEALDLIAFGYQDIFAVTRVVEHRFARGVDTPRIAARLTPGAQRTRRHADESKCDGGAQFLVLQWNEWMHDSSCRISRPR